MLGSNQGQVHSERQGTGLATVLQGNLAYNEGQQNLGQYALDKKAKVAELKTRRDAALKNLNDFHPEYWNVHNATIQKELDRLVDVGGKLIMASKSGDPFTDVTPEALAFQKDMNKVRMLAQKSKQMKDQDDKIRASLMGKDPEESNPNDIVAWNAWRESPLESAGEAPVIRKAAPLFSMSKETGVDAKSFSDQFGDQVPPEGALYGFVKDRFTDPKFAAGIAKNASEAFFSLSGAEQDAIRKNADANGLGLPEQMYADMMQRRLKAPKAFSIAGHAEAIAKRIQIQETKNGGQNGVSSSYDKKKYKEDLALTSFASTLDDPRAVKELIDKGYIDGSGDELADRKEAAKFYEALADPSVKKPETGFVAYKKSESEANSAEAIAKSNAWYSNIVSGDLTSMQAAANEMPLTKMPDGRMVESASVFTQPQPDGKQKNFLVLRTEPTKEVGKAGFDGISDDMVKNERIRLKATTGKDERGLMTPEELAAYEAAPAGVGTVDNPGKEAISTAKLKESLLTPKIFVELTPENENLLKNLYNPEQKAMKSSYSAPKGGGLWGNLPKAPIKASPVQKKRFGDE